MDGAVLPVDDHASFILAKKGELKKVVSELRESQTHMTTLARKAYEIVGGTDTAREIANAIRPK